MAWLLDTNAWIDYLKYPARAVRARLMERKPEEISTCSMYERSYCTGRESMARRNAGLAIVRETLAPYRSLPFDDAAAEHYAAIRHELSEEAKESAHTIC